MLHLLHKLKLVDIKINMKMKNKLLNNHFQKHPLKRANFSSLKKKNEQRLNNEKNNEINNKTNYIIEDSSFSNGLLLFMVFLL